MVTLIGDIVGSRQYPDRFQLQVEIETVLAEVNSQLDKKVSSLAVSIGDEFQAVFSTVSQAVAASILLRLAFLSRQIDSRYGIGVGEIDVAAQSIRGQQGEAWRQARAAISEAKRLSEKTHMAYVRTIVFPRVDSENSAVNAHLLLRDALIGQMGSRSQRILSGKLRGQTQEMIATAEGISQSEVSQNLTRSQGNVILAAAELLVAEEGESL